MAARDEPGIGDFVLLDEISIDKFMENLTLRWVMGVGGARTGLISHFVCSRCNIYSLGVARVSNHPADQLFTRQSLGRRRPGSVDFVHTCCSRLFLGLCNKTRATRHYCFVGAGFWWRTHTISPVQRRDGAAAAWLGDKRRCQLDKGINRRLVTQTRLFCVSLNNPPRWCHHTPRGYGTRRVSRDRSVKIPTTTSAGWAVGKSYTREGIK